MLVARDEEERLVEHAVDGDQHEAGQQQLGRHLGRDQHAQEQHLVEDVEPDVEPVARVAADQRGTPRKSGSLIVPTRAKCR